MNRAFIYLVVCVFWNCSAQKKQVNVDTIKEVQLDTSLVEKLLFPIRINDYDLEDETANLKLIINKQGLYQYKDSTLVNAETKIWLHKFPKIDKNKIPDCGESPISYGYLEGEIIKGKREGKWFKKIKTSKNPDYLTVKIFHYTNGILDGKYQVYGTNGRSLYPIAPHPLFPDEYENYETFNNGSGSYYDYYYETGILKVNGRYKDNIKHGSWIYYDKNGDEAMTEYYNNGLLIN